MRGYDRGDSRPGVLATEALNLVSALTSIVTIPLQLVTTFILGLLVSARRE